MHLQGDENNKSSLVREDGLKNDNLDRKKLHKKD